MAISSWSHSKIVDFEKCKFLCWLKHDQKIPEPERPLPPGKTEHANDRGSRVHDHCEGYVNGTLDTMPPEAEKHFGPQIDLLRVLHAEGKVSLEGEWAMTPAWEPTGWNGEWMKMDGAEALPEKPKTIKALPERGKDGDLVKVGKDVWMWVPSWLRLKLDAIVFLSDEEAIVIDYKTGKKYGNEIKHGEQTQLYQLVSFLRYPKLQKITTELWYLDQNEVSSAKFTRDQGLRFLDKWDKRGHKLTTNEHWPANPNIFSCQWCAYGPWGTGHCTVGVKK